MHVVNVLLAVTVAPVAVFVAIDIHFKHLRLSYLIFCLRQCDHSHVIRIHCDDDACCWDLAHTRWPACTTNSVIYNRRLTKPLSNTAVGWFVA